MNSTSSSWNAPKPESRIGKVLAGRLELTGILGVGAYGVVYKAVDTMTFRRYAVKALNKNNLDSRQERFQQREIALHLKASAHPNVVSLAKIVETSDCTFVIMEYCPEGDLFTNITERGHYVGNDDLAKRAFLQLLDAVDYCHTLGIYHRDLKPENVLVADRGYQVKLADFGLATTDSYTNDFGCGSTFYMSPECQSPSKQSAGYYASAPNDVWSLGVILLNLTCGRNPWKRASFSDSTYRAYLKDRQFLRTILPVSQEFNDILQRIFEPNPLKRISLAELRAELLACPQLTTGPGFGSRRSSVVDASPEEEFQVIDAYNLSGSAHSSEASGVITPPESSPATPRNQSILHQYAAYQKPHMNPSSYSYYSDSSDSPVVVSASPDFTASGRGFWHQFLPIFRREDMHNIPPQVYPHGVQVF